MLALAVGFVPPLEGRRLDPYYDLAHVLTVCDGHTGADIQQRRYSKAECDALLRQDLVKHYGGISTCMAPYAPVATQVAFLSFSYNVGTKAFCNSTMAAKAKVGDFKGACAQFDRWIYVAGKDCRDPASRCSGIVERRRKERALCEQGLMRGPT